MVTIHVHLLGRLILERYGQGRQAAIDGTFPLALKDGSTVRQAMEVLRVPASRVVLTMVNTRYCAVDTLLSSGDRVVLVPQDLAALWPARLREDLAKGIGGNPWAPVPARQRAQERLAAS